MLFKATSWPDTVTLWVCKREGLIAPYFPTFVSAAAWKANTSIPV